ECCRLGIPIAGVTHDLSKFLPSEWVPYAQHFYGDAAGRADKAAAFDSAWLYHQRRNPHHPQWWVLLQDSGETKLLPMPDRYRREMLADWIGAGRAQGYPDTAAWYRANRDRIP